MPEVIKRFSISLAALMDGKPGMRKMVHATRAYHIVPRPNAAGIIHAKSVATNAVIIAQAYGLNAYLVLMRCAINPMSAAIIAISASSQLPPKSLHDPPEPTAAPSAMPQSG